MNDYSDGKIHGWNGGDCPVHPESKVEVWFRAVFGPLKSDAGIGYWTHDKDDGDIIAFRVVEPYVEPKTIWVNEHANGEYIYRTEEAAKRNAGPSAIRIAVEYREVKK